MEGPISPFSHPVYPVMSTAWLTNESNHCGEQTSLLLAPNLALLAWFSLVIFRNAPIPGYRGTRWTALMVFLGTIAAALGGCFSYSIAVLVSMNADYVTDSAAWSPGTI